MEVLIRVYIINAENVVSKDDDGTNSDPFLIIKYGNSTNNYVKEHLTNKADPRFCK